MTIELRNLTKQFGTLTAVNSIDLDVDEGEVLCLLGPSGCGKTTTLRMIAGLEAATSGDVMLAGNRVNDLTARERNVAMSFQFYALYPSLSVAENLAYPLYAEKLSKSEIDTRVKHVADILQLGAILERKPGQLAEGEKQRVAVGRSIIREPTCFLFDEPLSRLDVQLREQMRGEIKEVLQGLKKPTVIVTHDQLEALTMADRISVMRDGFIEQVATPHGIFQQPANLFVAGFIGTPQMNLLPAQLLSVDDDNKASFQLDSGQKIEMSVNAAVANLNKGENVTIGVRPRNMDIVPEAVTDGISSVIDIIEPMGAETLAHLKSGEHDFRVVCDWRVPLEEGDTIHIRFQSGATHIFDQNDLAVRS